MDYRDIPPTLAEGRLFLVESKRILRFGGILHLRSCIRYALTHGPVSQKCQWKERWNVSIIQVVLQFHQQIFVFFG